MAFDKTTDILPIPALPFGDPCLHAAARDIALLSAGLIASNDAPLLAVAVPSDAWDDRLPVLLWDQRLSVCGRRVRAICETPMYAPALDALCLAADTVFERLREWGWSYVDCGNDENHGDADGPAGGRLCVITDGIGVALIPARPAAGPGWLLEMAAPGGHVALLPLAGDGAWSLIAAEARTALH